MRAVIGVIVGYAVWTAVFLGAGALLAVLYPDERAAFDDGGDYRATVPLLLSLMSSVVASLAAGFSTAAIAVSTASSPNFLAQCSAPLSSSLRV